MHLLKRCSAVTLVLMLLLLNPSFAKLAQPPFLDYNLSLSGVAHSGGSMVLVNSFENLGVDLLQVASLAIWADFGNLTLPSLPLPFNLSLGQMSRLELTTAIPITVIPGNHSLTAIVDWRYHNASYGGWVWGNPVVDNEPIEIQPRSGGLYPSDIISLLGPETLRILLYWLVGYLAFSIGVVLLFAWREEVRRTKAGRK